MDCCGQGEAFPKDGYQVGWEPRTWVRTAGASGPRLNSSFGTGGAALWGALAWPPQHKENELGQ